MSKGARVEFRPAKPVEKDTIRDVVRAAYAKWIPVIGREPMPMNADYEKAISDHDIDLLVVGSKVVGVIEYILRDDHLWIENIAIEPDEQGKGFGRRILEHAERTAGKSGLKEIRLLTNAAFETNVALYSRAGYVMVASEPFKGGTTVYFTKRLS